MPYLKGFAKFHKQVTNALKNKSETNGSIRGGPEDEVKAKIESEVPTPHSSVSSEYRTPARKSLDEFIGQDDPPEMRARYGTLPLVQSTEEQHETWASLASRISDMVGQEITFRARLHVLRRMSPKLAFLVFREQITTVQGVLEVGEGRISENMVRWAEHIHSGSIVRVKGKVQNAQVKGATVHDVEVMIEELHIVSARTQAIPFSVYEAELSDETRISDRTRFANRILDLRTPTSQSIFRIQSGVCNLFRSFLDSKGFVEIHTPKLQGGATEGGSTVFQVEYFGRPAFLAQSPQLAKQMCVAADFGRVYEIGPVFRAENSNTPRHMTEFTGLDIEMEIQTHYHEALRMIDETLKSIFKGVYDRYRQEIEVIKSHFPHADLVWLEKTPVIPFAEGIKMLRKSGWKEEDGSDPSEQEDLSTKSEKRLGALVKEQLHTDYYILDKFPVSARPFYTMPDPKDDKVTNSFDIFVRGQEVLSGAQRIHDYDLLEKRLRAQKIDPDSMQEYMEGFRWVAPPHAGGGIGLERLVFLLLQLENVRYASIFPRDPKSFPVPRGNSILRHPEDNTLHRTKGRLPKLENLVANYGDATNTSWMDDRYKIWRDTDTGAAVAYVPSHKHAILPGNPLCDPKQHPDVIGSFLHWLHKELHLKPIWVLVSGEVEDVLASKFGWKSLSCTAEQRVDLSSNWQANDAALEQKVRHAKKEGVTIVELGNEVPEDIKKYCDARIRDWQEGREGEQVHLSEITPWKDMPHRRYLIARQKDATICCLIVLAQLAPRYGVQIKWALNFPGAPGGAIEYATLSAMQAAKAAGNKSLTFGGGATAKLTAGENVGFIKSELLDHMYQAIANRLKLTQKSDFRAKFGTREDPVYICYPSRLGFSGPRAILDFFKDDGK